MKWGNRRWCARPFDHRRGHPCGRFVVVLAALAAACGPDRPSGQAGLASRDAESVPEELHPAAGEAISRLRSPYCPGFMLEVCPSRDAKALRDSIQMLAETGLNADSLVEWMIASHGEEYRAFPKGSGAGLLAWVAPPVALVVGLGLVVLALRRLKGPGTAAGVAEGLTEEERDRLHAALAQLEEMEEAES